MSVSKYSFESLVVWTQYSIMITETGIQGSYLSLWINVSPLLLLPLLCILFTHFNLHIICTLIQSLSHFSSTNNAIINYHHCL